VLCFRLRVGDRGAFRFRFISSMACLQKLSLVKPNSRITTSLRADAPKRPTPITLSLSTTIREHPDFCEIVLIKMHSAAR
jgi:hypothetical protein